MSHYSTDVPNIAAEIFDNEIVVADFVKGTYFSVVGSGAPIWQALGSGFGTAEIAEWLASHYGKATEEMAAMVDRFVAQLTAEGLIAPMAAGTPAAALPTLAQAELVPASLDRFDDLKDLLLLDPVHDVAEAGWPHLPEKGTA